MNRVESADVLIVVWGYPQRANQAGSCCTVIERAVLEAQNSVDDRQCVAFCVALHVQCNATAGHMRQACVHAATRHKVVL